jgi:cytochrome c biogenesis protein CcdA
MGFGTVGLGLLAGVLSTLSPCVLPLVPIVLGSALAEHRFGPAALAAGLALSFVTIGLFIATVGVAIGLDAGVFRFAAATLLVIVGAVLLLPGLNGRVALAAGPIGDWAERRFAATSTAGLSGQFGVGLLLGAVWSPCVGPTLGAASVLAAQGRDVAQAALTMFAFGAGAALPLLLIGLLSREALMRWRASLLAMGRTGKVALGVVLATAGLLVLSGLDKRAEAFLVEASPTWLTALTTRL